MRNYIQYIGLITLLFLISCNKSTDNVAYEQRASSLDIAEVAETAKGNEAETEAIGRKLIKNGSIEFETNDIHATRSQISRAMTKYKGYISSENEYKSDGRNSNTIVIRVPAQSFDHFLAEVTKGVDNLDRKQIGVEDVTEEFVDIQARLKTKKELEQRYLDLLNKAKNVTEILAIEKQIGELRAEIESIEGRLKYLEDNVAWSTLTITIYENQPSQTKFGEELKEGFINGWDNFMWFFVMLSNIWPFILIGFGFIAAMLYYIRRSNKKHNNTR